MHLIVYDLVSSNVVLFFLKIWDYRGNEIVSVIWFGGMGCWIWCRGWIKLTKPLMPKCYWWCLKITNSIFVHRRDKRRLAAHPSSIEVSRRDSPTVGQSPIQNCLGRAQQWLWYEKITAMAVLMVYSPNSVKIGEVIQRITISWTYKRAWISGKKRLSTF